MAPLVYIMVPPIAPEAQARRDALDLDALHTRNLRAIVAKIPGALVLDARRSGYPASAFLDSCHLNAQGAALLSLDLANAIATQVGRPVASSSSWITLPSPRLASLVRAPALLRFVDGPRHKPLTTSVGLE